jgi:hypothetical protein
MSKSNLVEMPKSVEQLQTEADRRNFSKIMRQRNPAKLLPSYWVVNAGRLALAKRMSCIGAEQRG